MTEDSSPLSLAPGTRMGVYEIVTPLGAGGMGEVYRARDARLDRDIAIKVLPEEVAGDAERRARFEQEARAASALNHPSIIHVYDIGQEGSRLFLAMELVEGRTLRELLDEQRLPLRKALEIGEQVAAGLGRAHAAGIVHRDLKPENIMVGADGLAKVLDFGLAKRLAGGSGALSELATTTPETGAGVVIGTAGYMAPEQARGAQIDFTADQFALGAVLYEMITGQRAFKRDSFVQTLSAIIEDDPEPISRHDPKPPPPVQWVVDRCLEKEPADRYASTLDLARDLRQVRENLAEISSAPGTVETPGVSTAGLRPRRLPVGILLLGLLAGAMLGAGAMFLGGGTTALSPVPLEPVKLTTLSTTGADKEPTVSPDGRTLVFVSSRDGKSRVWLRQLPGANEVALTDGEDSSPRFSPDGSMILFRRVADRESSLYRVATLGGTPRKVVDEAWNGDWSPDGTHIGFVRRTSEGQRSTALVGMVPVDGGAEKILARLDDAALFSPRFSPDGRWIATSATSYGLSASAARFIYLVPVDGGESRRLAPAVEGGDPSAVAWLGSGDEIIYFQGESPTAVALGALLLSGGSSRLVGQNIHTGASRTLLWSPTLTTSLDVVAPGTVVFDAAFAKQDLREFDLSGETQADALSISGGASSDRQPVYSPDGKRIAFSSNRSGNLDIWTLSVDGGELLRLTDHPADDWDPAFAPDGGLVWTSRRSGNFEIWMARADGTGARQVTHDGFDAENATVTADGQWVVYNSGNPERLGIWKVRVDGSEEQQIVSGTCQWPEVSPDGRYASFSIIRDDGSVAIHVADVENGKLTPFTMTLLNTLGAGRTRWLPDGRRIVFTGHQSLGGSGIFVQNFDPEGADTSGTRRPLVVLDRDIWAESFGISPDGTRITVAGSEGMWNLMRAENVPDLVPPKRSR